MTADVRTGSWRHVVADLERHGYTHALIAAAVDVDRSTVEGWKDLDSTLRHDDAERLIALWVHVTGRTRDDASRMVDTADVRGSSVSRRSSLLEFSPRPEEEENIPIGTLVRTPLGEEATVIDYRGYRRDHRIRLVCRYVKPRNRRYDIVQLLPELVIVVKRAEAPQKPVREAAAPVHRSGSGHEDEEPAALEIAREPGRTRVARIAPASTEDAKEREFQRRARQRPPKPDPSALERKRHEMWLRGVWDEDDQGESHGS